MGMQKSTMQAIKQGDVLVSHWGYDAHLSDFYIVKKRTAKMVEVIQLRDHHVNGYGMEGWDVAPMVPLQEVGKPIRRRVKVKSRWDELEVEYIDIDDYERAYVWDGKPVHNFDWH